MEMQLLGNKVRNLFDGNKTNPSTGKITAQYRTRHPHAMARSHSDWVVTPLGSCWKAKGHAGVEATHPNSQHLPGKTLRDNYRCNLHKSQSFGEKTSKITACQLVRFSQLKQYLDCDLILAFQKTINLYVEGSMLFLYFVIWVLSLSPIPVFSLIIQFDN